MATEGESPDGKSHSSLTKKVHPALQPIPKNQIIFLLKNLHGFPWPCNKLRLPFSYLWLWTGSPFSCNECSSHTELLQVFSKQQLSHSGLRLGYSLYRELFGFSLSTFLLTPTPPHHLQPHLPLFSHTDLRFFLRNIFRLLNKVKPSPLCPISLWFSLSYTVSHLIVVYLFFIPFLPTTGLCSIANIYV